MPSPPKPWERSGVQPVATPVVASTPAASSSSTVPAVPDRPSSLTAAQDAASTAVASRVAPSPYNSLATSYASPYTSPYGTTSNGSTYGSPYNRFGAGGYGGYGNYGGYGGMGYGGYGGYGGGYGANPFGVQPAIDPMTGQPIPSLIQQVESSTSQTFALIQSIVGTFTGFSQMLESTFMATHSSFFAMLGVAEQFTHLRMALGQVFGLFGLVSWLRGWWRGDRGRFRDDFKKFMKGEDPAAPKPSRKPLIVFLIMVFGLPYLMNRLIKHIMSRLPPPPQVQLGPDGQPIPQQVIDPSNLTFARAVYPFETKDPVELALAKGELVAVLQQTDPATGAESEWWQGRTREGRQGWFPRAFVDVVKQKKVDGEQPTAVSTGKIVA